jgi:ADP-ribose pyrophosphatase YjhB (NUDIX family)
MPYLTVCIVVLFENQVLLTKRNDFEFWCLPSGGVEDGESVAGAAIRETKEETGLDVKLKTLVGVYSRMGDLGDAHAILFSAVPAGGALQCQPGETIDVRFFPVNELPEDLSFGHHRRIEDAVKGFGGSTAVSQEMILPADGKITREDIWASRKLPREERLEFYRRTMRKAEIRNKTEIPGQVG